MKGHGEKLSRKKEQAILALLAEPTVERAAKACGIGTATLGRWLKDEEFKVSYHRARQHIVKSALARLQQTSGEAVETLRRNLDCGNASVEVRTALGVLDQTLKVKEFFELEERMQALEQLEATREGKPPC